VPIGVPGEIYIGGDGVARGYWRRPELTAERFVEHPCSARGAKLYRTGDLGRFKPDGVIEFLGRIDHQVKIRGHRIELGEIETVLAQQRGVANNVVVVRTDNPEDPRLAAYVVPAPGAAPDAAELKNALRAKLPAHLVPDFFVFLERLPLTPNGKIDRKALPPPSRVVAAPAVEPTSLPGLEQAITAIWRDILGVEHMSPDDNFFDSGGRSFQVVQVKARLKEALGVELPVIKLFQYPTIRSLADFIGSQKDEADALHDKIQERAQRRHHAMASRLQKTEEAKS
jgi:acyl carrier protein